MNLTLTLPLAPRSLHPNARVHWSTKAQATKAYRYECCVQAKVARAVKGFVTLTAPVTATVTFFVRDNRRRDEDGLLASIKAAFDGIVDSGLLEDDSSDKLHIVIGGVVVNKHTQSVCIELASAPMLTTLEVGA